MYQRRTRQSTFAPVLAACWVLALVGLGSGPMLAFNLVALAALGLVVFGLLKLRRRNGGIGRIPPVRTQPRNVTRP
jgi:hypothetical protein